MRKAARYLLFAIVFLQLLFALAYFLQWPFATGWWPFPGTTPLTFIFISSILAAAASSTMWVAATQEYAAIAGIGLDYLTIFAALLALSLLPGARSEVPQLVSMIPLFGLGVLFGLGLFLWGLRQPVEDRRPMPGLVRWSFVIFILGLWATGGQLVFLVPDVIPWKITPLLSSLIGWMFLGASIYFIYGLARPGWWNTGGQLAGFLAYDLVLIGPFLTRLPTVAPEHYLGQILYLVVVIYSGLLAIYYLFVHPATRLGRRPVQAGNVVKTAPGP